MSAAELEKSRYLDVLLKDYDLARGDDRLWLQLIGTVVTVLVAALGALAIAFLHFQSLPCISSTQLTLSDLMRQGLVNPTSDAPACTKSTQFLLAIIPLVPLSGLGLAALAAIIAAARSRYIIGLEQEIHVFVADEVERRRERGSSAPVMSWHAMSKKITGPRTGQVVYRLIVLGLITGMSIIFTGLIMIIAWHVTQWVQLFMVFTYSAITLLLYGALFKATSEAGAQAIIDELGEKDTRSRPLFEYLFFPRGVMKLVGRLALIIALTLALYVMAVGSFPNLHKLVVIFAMCLFFEWGIYSARDQCSDIRYGGDDIPTGPSAASNRSNRYTALLILLYRVTIPFVILRIFSPGHFWTAAIYCSPVIAVGFLSHGIRAIVVRRSVEETRWLERALWIVVCLGYATRIVVAWQISKFVDASPTWQQIALLSALVVGGGTIFVTPARRVTWQKQRLARAPRAAVTAPEPAPAVAEGAETEKEPITMTQRLVNAHEFLKRWLTAVPNVCVWTLRAGLYYGLGQTARVLGFKQPRRLGEVLARPRKA